MENNFSGTARGRGRGSAIHHQDLNTELRRPHNISQVSPNPAPGDHLLERPVTTSYAAAVAGGASGDNRQPDALICNTWNNDPLSQNLSTSNCSNDTPNQAVTMARNTESSLPERNNPTISYEITRTAVNVTPGVYLEAGSNFKKPKELSPFAKEFVPRAFQPATNDFSYDDITSDDNVLMTLNNFIHEVTCNPGRYDSSVKTISNFLKSNIKSDMALNAVVDTIFSQAIVEANFRYNAARLCNQLNTNCRFESLTMTFADAVVNRSMNQFSQRAYLLNSNPATLKGFTFFLGELYSQIEINDERIPDLAKCIPHLLETLLNSPSSDNFKCVCQVLKFTGANLEDDEKKSKGTAPTMGKVIKQLEDCIETAPKEVQNMMRSVVELQSKNWGRRASPSPPIVNNFATALPPDPFNMVCYGPDGQPLTEEEQLFLESNQPESDGENDDSSDEMDEEIRAAFNEFLVTTGQDQ